MADFSFTPFACTADLEGAVLGAMALDAATLDTGNAFGADCDLDADLDFVTTGLVFFATDLDFERTELEGFRFAVPTFLDLDLVPAFLRSAVFFRLLDRGFDDDWLREALFFFDTRFFFTFVLLREFDLVAIFFFLALLGAISCL